MNVDIIIPAHNPGLYLRDALNSCMDQTHKDYHIYVIDDCSDEDIMSLVEIYKKITYLRTPKNLGPGGARNYGIVRGDGELISFLDSDDIWMPSKLELSVKEFLFNKSIGMTCGNYQRLVNRKTVCNPFYRRPPKIDWEHLMKINYVASGSVTVRRSVLEDIGMFREDIWIGEDHDLWLRISQKYPIQYIDRILYHYSVVDDGKSLTSNKKMQEAHEGVGDLIRQESLEKMNELNRAAANNSNQNLSS